MFRVRYLFIVIVLMVIGCTDQQLNYPQRQMPPDIDQDGTNLAWAAETFRKKCAYCHGHESEGRGPRADFFEPPAPDFYHDSYRTVDPAYLFWRISEGKSVEPFLSRGSVMPAWGVHFSEPQIWSLVAFIRKRAADN